MSMARDFHVYAIDALYHGYSSLKPYDSEHRVERQAEAVVDFMDALGLALAHIEGSRWGPAWHSTSVSIIRSDAAS